MPTTSLAEIDRVTDVELVEDAPLLMKLASVIFIGAMKSVVPPEVGIADTGEEAELSPPRFAAVTI